MQRLVRRLAGADREHLIDPVGELVAAVLDMHRRLGMRQKSTVHIGDARHEYPVIDWRKASQAPSFGARSPLTPSDFSLRCKAERSIPTKAAVREILPPNRVTWATRYSRSKTSRASRSGRLM